MVWTSGFCRVLVVLSGLGGRAVTAICLVLAMVVSEHVSQFDRLSESYDREGKECCFKYGVRSPCIVVA